MFRRFWPTKRVYGNHRQPAASAACRPQTTAYRLPPAISAYRLSAIAYRLPPAIPAICLPPAIRRLSPIQSAAYNYILPSDVAYLPSPAAYRHCLPSPAAIACRLPPLPAIACRHRLLQPALGSTAPSETCRSQRRPTSAQYLRWRDAHQDWAY